MASPISVANIVSTALSLPKGKSPGPDCLMAEFYQTVIHVLAPCLVRLFAALLEKGPEGFTFTDSTITVLPKPDKDPKQPGSYRPISLINLESKLFAKILGSGLQPALTHFIHPDQTGFMKGRLAAENTHTFLDVNHTANSIAEPATALSIDAEKAFVRWNGCTSYTRWRGLGSTLFL